MNDAEPAFEAPADDALVPRGLTGEALAEWHAQLGGLVAKGVLTGPDMSQFRQYCWMYGEVCSLEDALGRLKGWGERRTKLSAHLSKLHARLTQQAAHFGITPSSRSSVKAVPVVAKDAGAAKRERFFGTSAS